MEKNERGSALVSSLPYSALSHAHTVMAVDGYAVEFTLPGFSTCTCRKPKPCTCWEGQSVLSSILFYFVHSLCGAKFLYRMGFFRVCILDLPCCEIQWREPRWLSGAMCHSHKLSWTLHSKSQVLALTKKKHEHAWKWHGTCRFFLAFKESDWHSLSRATLAFTMIWMDKLTQ